VLLALTASVAACRDGPAGGSAPPRSLRLVFAGAPETLDPQRHTEDLTRMVLANFYEGLVAFDDGLQIQPRLAVEWTSPSEAVWRFRLRRGVRFHDQHELQAADVTRTLDRARTLKDARVPAEVRAIASVREIDPWTVEIVTDRARPLLLAALAGVAILPRTIGDAEITHPVGTGPYRFTERDAAGVVSGERFEEYWQGPAPFAAFRIEPKPEHKDRVEAAVSGADLVSPVPRDALSGDGRPRGPFRVIRHPSVTVTFLVCRVGLLTDGRPSPFHDRRVRQALSLAIDREELIAAALAGEAMPAHQLVVPGVRGYVPDVPPPTTDRPAARRLLADAGFPAGFSSLLYTAQRGSEAGREIARQLGQVGIRLEVRAQSWPELFRVMRAGEAPLALASWTTGSGDSSSVLDPLLHSAGGREGLGSENTTGYADAELDAQLRAAGQQMDVFARKDLMASVMRRALTDLPYIPLYTPTWAYGVRNDIDFAPRLDLSVKVADLRPRAGVQ
jgi:peptide/nickel transport system substrate-binding protein